MVDLFVFIQNMFYFSTWKRDNGCNKETLSNVIVKKRFLSIVKITTYYIINATKFFSKNTENLYVFSILYETVGFLTSL